MEDGITKIVLDAGNANTTIFQAVIDGKINTIVLNDEGVTVTLFNGDQLFISKFTLIKMGIVLMFI